MVFFCVLRWRGVWIQKHVCVVRKRDVDRSKTLTVVETSWRDPVHHVDGAEWIFYTTNECRRIVVFENNQTNKKLLFVCVREAEGEGGKGTSVCFPSSRFQFPLSAIWKTLQRKACTKQQTKTKSDFLPEPSSSATSQRSRYARDTVYRSGKRRRRQPARKWLLLWCISLA